MHDGGGKRDEDLAEELRDLGVTIEVPESAKEESFSNTLEALAQFVLSDASDQTIRLLSQENDASVGELSGGNTEQSIYRLSFHEEGCDQKGAAEHLVESFNESHHQTPFSLPKLKQYMLQMCNKRNDGRVYDRLGNLMFILSLGPVHGQVRHIDHMNPNLQICLYMSRECPSTIIYDMAGIPINSCVDLLDHWTSASPTPLPRALDRILRTLGDVPLETIPCARFFASSWRSLNRHLRNFGRLYQPVSRQLQLKACDPGTTLIAGGSNHVHAGPPASSPRMFAFATGIPEDVVDKTQSKLESIDDEDDDNDGEVQYSPALLHLDFSCIVFGMLDFDEDFSIEDEMEIRSAKQFLLDQLVSLLKEYPGETYEQQLGEKRQLLKDWLQRLVLVLESPREIQSLLEEALISDALMYSPDVQTNAFRKFKEKHLKKKHRKTKMQRAGQNSTTRRGYVYS